MRAPRTGGQRSLGAGTGCARSSRAAIAVAASMALTLLPGQGWAQVGAFGGSSPTGLGVAGEQAHAQAPLFTPGAVFAARGEWSGTGLVGLTTGSFPVPGGVTVDFDVTQTALAGFYAPSDRLLVGVTVQPWNEVSLSAQGESVSESGRGDAGIQARYRVWNSADGASAAALGVQLGLPVAADGFGAEGVVAAFSGAWSRRLEGASAHASVGVALPFDDADGDATTSLTGAYVHGVGARASIAGELQARFSGGEHLVDLIPGVRFQPSPRLSLDAGVLLNVASSLGSAYDAGVVVAVRFGGN